MILDIVFWVIIAVFVYILCSLLGGCMAAFVKIALKLGIVIAGITLIVTGYMAIMQFLLGVLG